MGAKLLPNFKELTREYFVKVSFYLAKNYSGKSIWENALYCPQFPVGTLYSNGDI
jgi:hypothetical protein